MPKVRFFIGSSSERLPIARALKKMLATYADSTVWDEAPEFALGESTLDGLTKVGKIYDFALLVFGQDDSSIIRGSDYLVVRDNVIFELGMLMWKIGRGRALWLSPRGSKAPHTLTDLDGIVHLQFNEPDDLKEDAALTASLEDARLRICRHIDMLGPRNDGPVDRVPMKQVLCLASKQYSQARFKEDIEYIHRFFSPREVTSEQSVTADHFQDYFAPRRSWDIVDFGLFVDRDDPRMFFDPPTAAGDREFLRVEAVEGMIKQCGASLVVIITCDSLRFGGRLARFTNVIAGHQAIASGAALSWAKVFYQALSYGEPLSQSFYKAQDATDPGLILMARRDIFFRREA